MEDISTAGLTGSCGCCCGSCPVSPEMVGLMSWAPGKDPNSGFEAQLLLSADGFHTVGKSQAPKSSHCKQGTAAPEVACLGPGGTCSPSQLPSPSSSLLFPLGSRCSASHPHFRPALARSWLAPSTHLPLLLQLCSDSTSCRKLHTGAPPGFPQHLQLTQPGAALH